jgi:HD-GYP domain-containing protein (c-di-GMP phosphodiesterase class II)
MLPDMNSTNTHPFDGLPNQLASLYESSNVPRLRPAAFEDHTSEPRPGDDHPHTGNTANLSSQVETLKRQLENERILTQRLLILNDFSHGLEHVPDPELVARNMANKIIELLHCDLVCIFHYNVDDRRYRMLASSGPCATLVTSSYQPDLALYTINQAIGSGRAASNTDFSQAPKPENRMPLVIDQQSFPSLLAAPLIRKGQPLGLLLLASTCEQAFTPSDACLVEAAGALLLNAWDFAQQNETLTEFVQTVTGMSVIQEATSLLERIASIARRNLNASYTLVATHSQQEWLMRGSGRAPQIFHGLQNSAAAFLDEAVKSPYTFKMLDLRRDARSAIIPLDSPDLCTLLVSPIRLNGMTAGLLLAFGKIGAPGFNDLDVFLAERLAEHAAVNLESCYLNQEMRANLKTTQLLYDLSLSISQAESLTDAASAIARTAYRLMQATKCGLILFSPDGKNIEADVRFPTDDPSIEHPHRLIEQAVASRQTIYLAENEDLSKSAIPIQTMRRCYGALWMEYDEDSEENRHPADEIQILVNQAAVALERSILLEETRKQANEIARAYEDLLYGLTRALDARDRDTEWHSKRVEDMAVKLGIEMELTGKELQVLKRGALLHDIGKIGVPDQILLKDGPLDDKEWQEMKKHPQKGEEIIQEIPALRDALPVIASHQERWDGSGYPKHLKGTEIPLLARIFAVVDVYDALTSHRPYRTAMKTEEALQYLTSQAGIHFDPDVVTHFTEMVRSGKETNRTAGLNA